jgi:hypothetical protein
MSSVSVIVDRSAQRVPEERGQRPPRQALFTVAARTWKEWIGGAAVILAGLGGVLYGALFIAYGKFYEPLGTSPAEVGLDKVSILLASFGQLLYFTIGISLYFFLPMRPRGRAIWLPLVVLATLIIQLASLGHVMASRAVLVVKGQAVSNVEVVGIPLYSVSASDVTVTWVSATPPLTDILSHHLLYLGGAGGTEVFYDSTEHKAVRLPSTAVVIQVTPNARA